MDTQYWGIQAAIITILSIYVSTIDAKSCQYNVQGRHMDCTDVNLGTLKPGVYPLNISDIKILILGNSRISSLVGNEFHNVKLVEYLDLTGNCLKYLPHNSFNCLSELLVLNLGYNNIASLTDKRTFASQRKLRHLYLESNQLTTLPAEVLHPLVSLQRLYLARNPFICDCQLYPAMLWCQQKCFITEATCKLPANHTWSSWSAGNNRNCTELSEPRSAASEGDSCKYYCLYITYYNTMDCRNIKFHGLKPGRYPLNITTLDTLNLHNSGLTTLEPDVFSQLTRLRVLYLNGNKLESLDNRLFQNLTELYFIDLSNNRLVSLPDERLFASQGKLKLLLLSNNYLTSISVEIFKPLFSLTKLYLNGNPLECNCQFRATMVWSERRSIQMYYKCTKQLNLNWSSPVILKETEDCDTHEQPDVTAGGIPLLTVLNVVLLICLCFGLIGLCYWYRRRKSGSNREESAPYDDVGFTEPRQNLEYLNEDMSYTSIQPDLIKYRTDSVKIDVGSKLNVISSQMYDYVENMQDERK